MPSIVARSIPRQSALCCGRAVAVCQTATDSKGLALCMFACPLPVCPVHQQDIQLYCSEHCFIATHAQQIAANQPPSPNPTFAPVSAAPAATAASVAAAVSASASSTTAPARSPARVGKYILGKTLGQGTFGKVKLAVHQDTNVKRALKVMDKGKIRASGMGEQIKKEISIMQTLRHANIIQLIEVLASSTSIYLVLELVTGGELFDVIVEQGRLEEDEARRYFRQLVSGLSYCHERGVCHRDLKPENLLLDEAGVLKISDFGLSTLQQGGAGSGGAGGKDGASGGSVGGSVGGSSGAAASTAANSSDSEVAVHLLHTTCGTPNYVAPEVLMDAGYDGMAADVWSSGVILYVLLAGFLPFDEVSMVDLFRKIMKADFSYPAWFSAEAKDLLSSMIQPKVNQRASMKQIQEHPWLKMTDDEAEGELDEAEEYAETASGGKERSVSTDAAVATSFGISAQPSPQPSPRSSPTGADAAAPPPVSLGTGSLAAPAVVRQTSDPPGARPVSPRPASPSATSPTTARPLRRTTSALLLTMDEEEEEEELKARATPASAEPYYGPRILNAFDFINMVGGAAMNRMFSSSLQSHSASFTRKREVRQQQFTSNEPWQALLLRLERVLGGMEGVECRRIDKYAQVRAVRDSGRGVVGLVAQVHEMTPQLYLVECRKSKGDVFVYNELYTELKRRMMAGKGQAAEGTTVKVEAHAEERKDSGGGGGSGGKADGEAAVIRAGRQSLTIQRPGSGANPGASSTGSNSSNSSGGGGSGLRGKLNIVVTPNTPLPNAADEADEASDASGRSALTPNSQLYNHTPNSSAGVPTTPQSESQ